ncbi:MAG: hypothetical protein M1823_007173, partial [Watsoniomyces obsoletus]
VSRNMRTKAVLKLIAPYSRFTLQFVAKHIKIPISEVQDILGVLIVDKKLKAQIDQENGTVLVDGASNTEHLQRLRDWTLAVENLFTAVLNDGEGYRVDDNQGGSLGGLVSSFPSGGDGGAPFAVRSQGKKMGGRGGRGGKLFAAS